MRTAVAALSLLLLACPAAADMYQDASNAKLPNALSNLGLGTEDTPGFAGLKINGGVPSSQFGIKRDGTSTFLMSILNPSGTKYIFTLYSDPYMALQTSSVDGYTGGPPMVLGYDTSTPTNGMQAGHYAFQTMSGDNQRQTISFIDAIITDVNPAAMQSQLRIGVMNNSVSSPPTVGQPNSFMIFDKDGLQVPGAMRASAQVWGTSFVSNGNNVLLSDAGLTQVYDPTGLMAIGLAGGYNAYTNTQHLFTNIGGGTRFVTIDSFGIGVPAMPTTCIGAASKTLWNNAGVVNICP